MLVIICFSGRHGLPVEALRDRYADGQVGPPGLLDGATPPTRPMATRNPVGCSHLRGQSRLRSAPNIFNAVVAWANSSVTKVNYDVLYNYTFYRNYKRKTGRKTWKESEEMKSAIDNVVNGGISVYAASKRYGIYQEKNPTIGAAGRPTVLSPDQEAEIVETCQIFSEWLRTHQTRCH